MKKLVDMGRCMIIALIQTNQLCFLFLVKKKRLCSSTHDWNSVYWGNFNGALKVNCNPQTM